MWLKYLILSIALSGVFALNPPRKLLKSFNEQSDLSEGEISPFVDPNDGISYRLPNNTTPLHYDLSITTDIHRGEFEFSGEVRIRVRAIEQTSVITLHHRYLTIFNVTFLRGTGGTLQQNVPFTYNETTEFLELTPRLPLSANSEIWIVINFLGILRNDEAGFYRSSYTNVSGVRKWLAVTQFESTDARHGFPCFDEPALRSTYSITIRHHYTYNAVSNMPVKSSERESASDYVITSFETTPLVHSYLIAYMVSDFQFYEDERPIPQRVYAKPQSIANKEYEVAINVAGPLLETFAAYLDVPYSLPKMDQLAIPDFAAGAMENWGLVTYREIYLLFNEKTGTTRDQENIETVIAHEFAVSILFYRNAIRLE
jgi:aminopeptidase N